PQEVQVSPAQRRARFLLRPVADARRQPAVLAFGDGHLRRHFSGLERLVFLRLDVGELKELEVVQLALRLAHLLAREEVPFLIGELPPNDVLADAFLAVDLDRTEMRERSRRRGEGDLDLVAARALLR